jgi:hypothetical protein
MYKKFDDPNPKVDQSGSKISGAFDFAVMRSAIMGVMNEVLGGTAGTGYVTAGCEGGSSSGVQTANPVIVKIDGVAYTITAQNNIPMPTSGTTQGVNQIVQGTQGTNTVCKYLIYAGTSGSAFVAQGNIVDKGDTIKNYANAAAAALDAKLPDLPDYSVALGYLQLNTPVAAKAVIQTGTLSTMGTVAYTDLFNMPVGI